MSNIYQTKEEGCTFDVRKTEEYMTSLNSPVVKFSKTGERVTSLHGIRHIGNSHNQQFRRFIWILLFISCGSLFVIQMVLSVKYYLSWPVSVNVKINYNKSIVFPAVTICNNNAFRLTSAYDQGFYEMITEYYRGGEGQGNGSVDPQQLRNISLEHLYQTTGHRKEDFIVSCTWEGSSCTDGLEPTFTDFGLCYTFNGHKDTSLRKTYSSGSEGGVSFQLNIEQYEYMAGPNEGAGVKLLIHNRGDVPLVRDNGVALQPGTFSFVATKIIEMNSLPPKHGECCDTVDLQYLPDYSIHNCFIDCKQRFVVERCGCRDIYMAANNGSPPVCSLAEVKDCLTPSIEIFLREKNKLCRCPTPCRQTVYESVVSSAGTSNFDITKFLQQTERKNKLQAKFREARRISTKVDNVIIQRDSHFVSTVQAALQHYNRSLVNMDKILHDLPRNISRHVENLSERFEFHFHKCTDRQEFNIYNAYVRYFVENHRNFFKPVMADYTGVKALIEVTLNATELVQDTRMQRRFAFWSLKDILTDRKKTVDLASKEIKKITKHYETARKLNKFPISYARRYDLVYQQKGLTSGDVIGHNRLYLRDTVLEALTEIEDNLKLFLKFGTGYIVHGVQNMSLLNATNGAYIKAMDRYISAVHNFEQDVVRAPLVFMQNEMFNALILNNSLETEETRILQKMHKNLKLFTGLVQKYWYDIIEIFNACRMYTNNDISKSVLAEFVTSDRIHGYLNDFKSVMEDLRKSMNDAKQQLRYLKVVSTNVWNYILLDPFHKDLYEKIYYDTQLFVANDSYTEKLVMPLAWFVNYKFDRYVLANLTLEGNMSREEMVAMLSNADVHTLTVEGVTQMVNDQITQLRLAMDHALGIIDDQENLHYTISQFIAYMREFLATNHVNSEFYKENFLGVDIYLQELRYEENTAQKAYGIISLLSDIGGAMGFFIGGSFLSIVEVLDVLVHKWLKTLYIT